MRILNGAVAALVVLGAVNVPPANSQPSARLPSGFYRYGAEVRRAQMGAYGVAAWDPYLLAQVHQESAWRPSAVSPVGARGLTQFMPRTESAVRRKYGVTGSIWAPAVAGRLQGLLMRENAIRCWQEGVRGFHGLWWCALATYNGSPRNFYRERAAAGNPSDIPGTFASWPCLRGRWAWCRENRHYPDRIQRLRNLYVRATP